MFHITSILVALLVILCNILGANEVAGNRRHGPPSLTWPYQQEPEYHPHPILDDVADEALFGGDDDYGGFGSHDHHPSPSLHHNAELIKPLQYNNGRPEIETQLGTIRGIKTVLSDGKVVFEFLGIPFAKPPLEELRFKRPVPADKFDAPYDAVHLPNACAQKFISIFPGFVGEEIWHPNTNVSEDCLYLNIWVPEDVMNKKVTDFAAVFFWIYGGGFFSGSSSLDIYNGRALASQENVIVVSTQYRIGPLGFLFFGTEEAPGNSGLMDQQLALKWTNENIRSFGGDPDSITLMGESAGSVSVGLHLLSPDSKSLFKRAVMMSGVPTAPVIGYSPPNVIKRHSYKLAKLAGCSISKPVEDIIACLKTKDASLLMDLQWNRVFTEGKMLEFIFKPTLDGTFLTDTPANIIQNGEAKRADLMIGTVQNEGAYFMLYQYLRTFHRNRPTHVSRDKFTQMMRNIFKGFSRLEQDAIIGQYANWDNPEEGLVNQQRITDAVGDYFFTCPNRKFCDSWSNRGLNTYYYHFTQRTSSNPWADWMGVLHSDEIPYFLGHTSNSTLYTPGEQQLGKLITQLLATFGRTGTPSENWERYTSEVPIYVDFNATIPSDKTNPNKYGPRAAQCNFWNNLLPKIKHMHVNSQRWKQSYVPEGNPWTAGFNRNGVHGGQGFHSDTLDWASRKNLVASHIPVASAVHKDFGAHHNDIRCKERTTTAGEKNDYSNPTTASTTQSNANWELL